MNELQVLPSHPFLALGEVVLSSLGESEMPDRRCPRTGAQRLLESLVRGLVEPLLRERLTALKSRLEAGGSDA